VASGSPGGNRITLAFGKLIFCLQCKSAGLRRSYRPPKLIGHITLNLANFEYSVHHGFKRDGFEILGHNHLCFRGRSGDLLHEGLQGVDCGLLRSVVRR